MFIFEMSHTHMTCYYTVVFSYVQSNLREREQGDRKLFGGCYWPWNDCSDRTTIKAVFDSNNNIYGVKGTIKFIQSSDELTSGKWVVKLNEFDLDKAESQDGASCANNLNFHIHENKVDDSGECGFAVTGNHWDPTVRCYVVPLIW